MKIEHELEPFYNQDSKILILGTMPSVKSREFGFYYAHPKNRFWWVLSQVYQEELPTTIEDKKKFLKKHYIALFDVLKTCSIEGSSDASIKNPIPNDLSPIFNYDNDRKNLTLVTCNNLNDKRIVITAIR